MSRKGDNDNSDCGSGSFRRCGWIVTLQDQHCCRGNGAAAEAPRLIPTSVRPFSEPEAKSFHPVSTPQISGMIARYDVPAGGSVAL
jgi:hypothetical protein